MADTSGTQIVTGKVRLSFAHLFEPYAAQANQDPKYSCMILIPKSDTDTLEKVRRAQQLAAEAGKTTKFGGKIPPNLHYTLRDADEEGDLERYPEMAGHYFMNLANKTAPGLIDKDKNPILDRSQLYSGCYVRVQMGAFAYNSNGNKGVSFGLNHVQKWADGEPLDGSTKAEDWFDPIEDEEPATSLI